MGILIISAVYLSPRHTVKQEQSKIFVIPPDDTSLHVVMTMQSIPTVDPNLFHSRA
jgi:hypothetical protein